MTRPELYSIVLMPDDCFQLQSSNNHLYGSRYWTAEFKDLISEIKLHASSSCPIKSKKVYLTRTQINDNRDFGEKQIQNLFKKKGYLIIAPEKYSIADQLSIYANCDEIVATESTVAHNAIFAATGSKLVILKKADYINYYQEAINDMVGLSVTYICCHHSNWCHPVWYYLGPFYMCVTSDLKNYLKMESLSLPFWLDPIYWYYSLYGMWQCLKRMKQRLKNIG